MTTHDARIADLFDRLLPRLNEPWDWERVLADAAGNRTHFRRERPKQGFLSRRLAISLLLVLVAIVLPLTAFAVGEGWWFLRWPGAPKPLGPVGVVTTGRWNGVAWTLTAYRSVTDGVCFGVTPVLANNGMQGGAEACAQLVGIPRTRRSKHGVPLAITYLSSGGDAHFPDFITGPVVASATTVKIILADGQSLAVKTIPATGSLRGAIRFYITELPNGRAARRVIGYDNRGRVVAHLSIPSRIRVDLDSHVSNHGVPLALPSRLRHQLRLAHRSTQIHLLATRDGRNFYRLGHACYGVGKAKKLATIPATRRGLGQLAGIIVCPGRIAPFPSPTHSVIDLSVFSQSRGQDTVTLVRLQGFASDAVKSIDLLDDHGRVIRRVPVIKNVYSLARSPHGVTVIAAIAGNGQQLARCGPNAELRSGGSYLATPC